MLRASSRAVRSSLCGDSKPDVVVVSCGAAQCQVQWLVRLAESFKCGGSRVLLVAARDAGQVGPEGQAGRMDSSKWGGGRCSPDKLLVSYLPTVIGRFIMSRTTLGQLCRRMAASSVRSLSVRLGLVESLLVLGVPLPELVGNIGEAWSIALVPPEDPRGGCWERPEFEGMVREVCRRVWAVTVTDSRLSEALSRYRPLLVSPSVPETPDVIPRQGSSDIEASAPPRADASESAQDQAVDQLLHLVQRFDAGEPEVVRRSDGPPAATVIVPCFNESRVLGRCLESLGNQTLGPLQIVVVDDGSTDGSPQVVHERAPVGHETLLIRQRHQGPAVARNRAAQYAEAATLVFIDADMIAGPRYVEGLLEPIAGQGVKGTFTINEFVANRGVYLADAWSVASGLALGKRYPADHPPEARYFRALDASEFRRIGGYGDRGVGGVGEDRTLSERLGYVAQLAPLATCEHENPETLRDYWNSAAWYGRAGGLGRPLWRSILSVVKRLPPISLVFRWRCRPLRYMPGVLLYDLAFAYGILDGLVRKQHFK